MTAAPARWLSIIGIGEDGGDALSPAARTLIAQASLVVGGRRHLALVAGIPTGETLAWPSPPQAAFPTILARRGTPVCVVASGDPFFYGIGSLLAREVPPEEIICLPLHPPSASPPAASAGRCRTARWSRCMAGHWNGSSPTCSRVPVSSPCPGTRRPPANWLTSWSATVFGDTSITVCEALGGPRERLTTPQPTIRPRAHRSPEPRRAGTHCAAPPTYRPADPGLPDDWFEHDGQLTKQDFGR